MYAAGTFDLNDNKAIAATKMVCGTTNAELDAAKFVLAPAGDADAVAKALMGGTWAT
jgi:hypothetical protein